MQGKDAYRLEKLSSDIAALITALGHDTCVLVAHDWGGVVAWLAAHTHQSMIEQLVVIAAPHPRSAYDWDQFKRSDCFLAVPLDIGSCMTRMRTAS